MTTEAQKPPARDPGTMGREERLDQVRKQAADFMSKRGPAPTTPQLQVESHPAPLGNVTAEQKPPVQATDVEQKQEAPQPATSTTATEAHEKALTALRRFGFGEDVTRGWSLDLILEKGGRLAKMQADFDALKTDVRTLKEGKAGKAEPKPEATELSEALEAAGVDEDSEVGQAIAKLLDRQFRAQDERLQQALAQVNQAVMSTAQRELDGRRAELTRFYPSLAGNDAEWARVQERVKRLVKTGEYKSQNEVLRDACLLELGAPRDIAEERTRDGARPTIPTARSAEPLNYAEQVQIAARHLRANPGDIKGAKRAAGF